MKGSSAETLDDGVVVDRNGGRPRRRSPQLRPQLGRQVELPVLPLAWQVVGAAQDMPSWSMSPGTPTRTSGDRRIPPCRFLDQGFEHPGNRSGPPCRARPWPWHGAIPRSARRGHPRAGRICVRRIRRCRRRPLLPPMSTASRPSFPEVRDAGSGAPSQSGFVGRWWMRFELEPGMRFHQPRLRGMDSQCRPHGAPPCRRR